LVVLGNPLVSTFSSVVGTSGCLHLKRCSIITAKAIYLWYYVTQTYTQAAWQRLFYSLCTWTVLVTPWQSYKYRSSTS